jgi:hypothetical protein
MTIDTDKLKALALAATPGKWQSGYGNGVLGGRAASAVSWDLTDVRSMPVIKGEEVIAWLACYQPDDVELRALSADADYIAAACPATVLALIAEVERLRADAERYRWLRDKANDERSRAPMVFNCHPEDVISWTDSLHGTNLDAVLDVFVDAAIEKEKA